MREHFPALIVVVPLLASLVTPFVAYLSKRLVRWFVVAAILVAHISSIGALVHSLEKGPWHYHFGGWLPPWGIEYVVDPLAGVMAVLISFVGLIAAIRPYPAREEISKNT